MVRRFNKFPELRLAVHNAVTRRARTPLRTRLLVGLFVLALGAGLVGLWGIFGLVGGGSGGAGDVVGLRSAAALALGLGLCLGGVFVGLLVLSGLAVARPLADIERSASALSRGELQQPVVLSAPATAEIRELQLVFEEMRRALLTKLRSSTEMNLQLESEVARRSTELSRRNVELQEALETLRTTRDELLRTEKLAAVGRIAARVTDAIYAPVSTVASIVQSLRAPLFAICSDDALRPPLSPVTLQRIREMDDLIERLLRDALRVRDIVRAMRVYARPSSSETAVKKSELAGPPNQTSPTKPKS